MRLIMDKKFVNEQEEVPINQERLMDVLIESWESQERCRLVDLPRWAQ